MMFDPTAAEPACRFGRQWPDGVWTSLSTSPEQTEDCRGDKTDGVHPPRSGDFAEVVASLCS